MYHSLEVRSPFLDRDLIDFVSQINLYLIRSNFNGKMLLKDIFSSNIPKQIISRRKQGFSSRIYNWFLGNTAQELESLCTNLNTPIRKEKVAELLSEHKTRKYDRSLQLWNIYSYLKWVEGSRSWIGTKDRWSIVSSHWSTAAHDETAMRQPHETPINPNKIFNSSTRV